MVIDGTEIGIFPRQHGEIEDLRLLFLPIHIFQLVRCGPEGPRAPEVIRIPSGPLVGGLELEDTDQWTDRRSGAAQPEMVETRRLELLTLSLQRRCSAN